MNKYILAISVAFFVTSVCAGEPFESPDALEKEMVACLMKKDKSLKCMETILGRRVIPGGDQLLPISKQLDSLLKEWLAGDSIYAVHPIRTKKSGEIYDKRIYIIEDTAGNLMAFNVTSIKKIGKWYIYQFDLSSKAEELSSVLKGE
jgi:hypothetical protein